MNNLLRLSYFHNNRHKELFNLEEDIGEHTDLTGMQPRITRQPTRTLSDQLRKVTAQMPRDNKTKQPIPFSDEIYNTTS